MAASTIWRSITFSRATASAICKSSRRFALTAMGLFLSAGFRLFVRLMGPRIFGLRGLLGVQLSLVFCLDLRSERLGGDLGAAKRFRHQGVGQDEMGFAHLVYL